MITFAPTEVRASEVSRGCDRMSVLRARGTEALQPDDEQREWFSRGHLFEWYVGRQLDAKHGRENIVRQPEFEHPLGTGHSDFLIVPDRLLVEVKSTMAGTLSTPVFDNGVEQLRIAIHFHPDADEGALYMINPSTLKPADVFRVVCTDEDHERIDAMFARIQEHIVEGTLPERVCAKPGKARGMFCAFAEDCFAGWQPPEPYVVEDERAVEIAARLVAIQAKREQAKGLVEGAEQEQRDLKAELSEYVPEKAIAQVGDFQVQTWPVKGQVKVNAKAMLADGLDPTPYTTVTASRVEVRVKALEDADPAGDDEYGGAPF